MKRFLTASLISTTLCFTGCASIISGSTQTLSFKSVPDNSKITITNRNGEKIHTGQTPATVTLKKGAGYFKSEQYQVTFSKDGYETKTVMVTGGVSGWYVANLLFGGLIGLLIVDPLTGAMYNLSPEDVNAVLEANNVKTTANTKSLTVVLKQDVPQEIMARANLLK
ncbi:hypothetical protein OZX61_07300 [Acinetobacter sp. ESL0695]|uniref:hypothetical protein n=1 Tax=Acinetobacter sp. ESL0695 TaxID=2983215 RepID=UPI0023F02CFB|nr:hypothetical protein [Acinetobacter sp. ESL0695]WEV48095.1 hypothetical protein OZX61_07300 [Acinetobacter sp. ESL0695]